jgi:hypothetical protein
VLVVLALAAWSATRPPPERDDATSSIGSLEDSLDRWTGAAPRRVHLSLDGTPNAEQRQWLRALRHAGTPITWDRVGDAVPPVAVEVAPVPGPRGGTMVSITAPAGTRVAVADAIASIDTVVAAAGGARVFAPIATGPLTAIVSGQRASATVRDTLEPRRILVLGRATWEAKFVIAALEEVGWQVDARLLVAPGAEVTQGTSRVPDTAHHAAVIVLDAPPPGAASAIARYVRSGGGAVLSGAGASASLTEIAAGRTGARVRPSSIAFAEDAPRRALAFVALVPRDEAIVLEERDGRPAAAARRVDGGRVIQLGYDETWRWRFAGGASALEAHRTWWNTLISSVAYRAAEPLARGVVDDAAPLARLVDALGPPGPTARVTTARAPWSPSPVLLFAVVAALLVAELASRRLRGAP